MNKVEQRLIFSIAIALLVALLPLPYDYYKILRIVMCGGLVFLAHSAWRSERQGFGWLLGFTAAIYNPFIPLHLGRELWMLINILTIALLILWWREKHSSVIL